MSDIESPIWRGPNDGEQIYAGGDRYRFLAVKEETNCSYALWEAIIPPGRGLPPHLHRNEEEGFYVVDGTVTVNSEDTIAAECDRVVKLPSTFLKNQGDHIVLPGHHGVLPWRRDASEQAVHFLRNGQFGWDRLKQSLNRRPMMSTRHRFGTASPSL